ncbi:MAG: DUF2341 domain-containing protein [Proteobacteria bacterium]|nr:DUF2341 domain-containing protein [Pseudomonadota bacterium]MBU1710420.1 DUF2341 domain-containing protein [Pseudomonadota bacterium]
MSSKKRFISRLPVIGKLFCVVGRCFTRRMSRYFSAIILVLLLGCFQNASGEGGEVLNRFSYLLSGKQEAVAVAVDTDGSMVITGYTQPTPADNQDFFTIKVNPDTTGLEGLAWSAPATFDLTGGDDYAVDVVIDHQHNIIVVGAAYNGTNFDFQTIKYCGNSIDPVTFCKGKQPGQVIWQHTYNYSTNGNDYPVQVAVDVNNNIYVGGYTHGLTGNDDFLVIKYSKDGPIGNKPSFIRPYNNNTANDHDRINSIAVSAGEPIYIAATGISDNDPDIVTTDFDYLTVKYDSELKVLWAKLHDGGSGDDHALVVKIDTENDVIVTGHISNGTDDEMFTIKYLGEIDPPPIDWTTGYDSMFSGGADKPNDIIIDSANNVYITGTTWTLEGATDFFTAKYYGDSSNSLRGQRAWPEEMIFDSGNGSADTAPAMVIDDNSVYVTGYMMNAASNYDFLTIKYDLVNGNEIWTKMFDGPANADDKSVGLGLSESGKFYVAGWSNKSPSFTDGLASNASGSTTVIEDSTKNWSVNQWAGLSVKVTSGTNIGVSRQIASNTQTSLTVATVLPSPVVTGDTYYIFFKADNASAGSTDRIIIDTDYNWPNNLFAGYYVYITSGTHNGLSRQIQSNTSNTLTLVTPFPNGDPVAAGVSYYILDPSNFDFQAIQYDPGVINTPTSLRLSLIGQSDTDVKVQWDINSTNEDGFQVFRKLCLDPLYPENPHATVGQGVSYFDDSPSISPALEADKKYCYQVRAFGYDPDDLEEPYDILNYSHFSNEAGILTTNIKNDDPVWIYKYIGPGEDKANAIAVGPDLNPVITGYSYSTSGTFDYFTARLNYTNASEIWTHRYDDAFNESDEAQSIIIDSNNNPVVSGYSSLSGSGPSNTFDFYTVKYYSNFNNSVPPRAVDSGNKPKWKDAYDGPGNKDDRVTAIAKAKDASDNIVIIGYGRNASVNDDIFLIKYLANGTRAWATVDHPEYALQVWDVAGLDDKPVAVVFDYNGDILIAGRAKHAHAATHGNTDFDIVVRKYSGVDGTPMWSVVYDSAFGDDEGADIAVDTLNNVYVTGYVSTESQGEDIFLTKYCGNSDPENNCGAGLVQGDEIWARPYTGSGAGDDFGVGVAVDISDEVEEVVVGGTTFIGAGNNDFFVMRYDLDGNNVWNIPRILDRQATNDSVVSMKMDVSGNVYLGGNTNDSGSSDILAVIYDYVGEWKGGTIYDGLSSNDDGAKSVAVSRVGNAYVAGYTHNGSNYDYVAIEFIGEILQAPAPFTLTAYYTYVDLNWANNTLEDGIGDGYNLERQNVDCNTAKLGGAWTLVSGDTIPLAQTSYRDTGLTIEDTYCYRIQTVCDNGEMSRWIYRTIDTVHPPAPDALSASIDDSTTVTLTWIDTIADEDSYAVQRCDQSLYNCLDPAPDDDSPVDARYEVLIDSLPPGTHTYTDPTACSGKTYTYRIQGALNGFWTSYFVYLVDVQATPFATPTVVSAIAQSEGRIDLTWTDTNTDETSFKIYRCLGLGCDPDQDGALLPVDLTGSNIPAGSIVHMKMNESWSPGVADMVVDSSGNNHHGTAYGNASGGFFDGVDDYVSLGDIDALDAPAALSVEIWFKKTGEMGSATNHLVNNVLIAQSSDAANDNLEIGIQGNSIEFYLDTEQERNFNVRVESGTAADTGITLEPDTWYHLVLTYDKDAADGNETKLYFQGALLGQWNTGGGYLTSSDTSPLTIGMARPDGSNWGDFKGAINQLTIYDHAITLAEVQNSYANGLPAIPTFYSDFPLNPNAHYNYEVMAYKIAAGSPECPTGWETDPDLGGTAGDESADIFTPGVPNAPTNISVTTNAVDRTSRIDITWNDNTEFEEGFILERCVGGLAVCTPAAFVLDPVFGVSGVGVTLAMEAETYSDTTVCNNTEYTYRVKAIRPSDPSWLSGSAYTEPYDSDATNTINNPTGLSASYVNEEEIRLTWTDNSIDETGFKFQRCTGVGCTFSASDPFILVPAHPGTGVVTFNDIRRTPNESYTYQVQAYKSSTCNWSTGFSNPFTITTNIAGSITLDTQTVNTTRSYLHWNDIRTKETTMFVERCTGASCVNFAQIYGVDAIDDTLQANFYYDDTTLCPAETYKYRVKGVDQDFENGMGGCWTKRKQMTISQFQPESLVEVKINYLTGMQADFDDLRFYKFNDYNSTGRNGEVIPYMLIKKVNNSYAKVLLKTPANGNDIYMYYGNASAIAVDKQVFIARYFTFYHDFPGSTEDTTNIWDIARSGSDYGEVWQDNGLYFQKVNVSWEALVSKQTFARNVQDLTMYVRMYYRGGGEWYFGFQKNQGATTNTDAFAHGVYMGFGAATAIREGTGSYSLTPAISVDSTFGVEYDFKITANKNGGATYYLKGGEGTSKYYADWTLLKDTTGSFAPKISNTPLKISLLQYTSFLMIYDVSLTNYGLYKSDVVLADMPDDPCFVMPHEWDTAYSPIMTVVAGSKVTPSLLDGNAISESEMELTVSDANLAESGFDIQYCQGDIATLECQNQGDFTYLATIGSSPLVHLKFDNDFTNSENNTYHGSAENSVPFNGGGKFGSAAAFDSTGYVSLGTPQGLKLYKDNAFTLEGWFRPSVNVQNMIDLYPLFIFKRNYLHGGYGSHFSKSNGKINVQYCWEGSCLGVSSTTVFMANTWYHYAGTFDGTTLKLYINGVLEGSLAATIPMGSSEGYRLTIGENFEGLIDDVAIYNRALSSAEILDHMNKGVGTRYVHTGLELSTPYTYQIRANKVATHLETCTDDWPTAYSAKMTAKTDEPPAPINFRFTVPNTTQINLQWDDKAGSNSGYVLEREVYNSSVWNFVASLEGDVGSFNDSQVCKNTQYNYRLRLIYESFEMADKFDNTGAGEWRRKKPLTFQNFAANHATKVIITRDDYIRTDFGDIRFYDETTGTKIPYWIESISGNTAVVWFKPGVNNTISLYYDNPGATSESSGPGTFLFFDNFDGTALDVSKWPGHAGETVSGGVVTLDYQTNSQASSEDYIYASNYNVPINTITEFRNKSSATTTHNRFGITDTRTTFNLNSINYIGFQLYSGPTMYTDINNGGTRTETNRGAFDTSWHTYKLVWTPASVKYYQDTTLIGEYTTNIPTSTDTLHPLLRDQSQTDWVRVRNYLVTEPTVGVGVEEVAPDLWEPLTLTSTELDLPPAQTPDVIEPLLYSPEVAFAGAGGEVWEWRKLLTISNFRTDFQTKIVVQHATGMRADFSDVRFYQFDNNTETTGHDIEYWLEKKTDGSSATFWIKTGASKDRIYMYYGNPNAVSTSTTNPGNIFLFFDDFDDGVIDNAKWPTQVLGTSISESIDDGELRMNRVTGSTSANYIQSAAYTAANLPLVVSAKTRTLTAPANGWSPVMWWQSTGNGASILDQNGTGGGRQYVRNFGQSLDMGQNKPLSEYHVNSLVLSSATDWTATTEYVTTTSANWSAYYNNYTFSGTYYIKIGPRHDNANYNQAMDGRVDWVLVRKYAATEPSISFGTPFFVEAVRRKSESRVNLQWQWNDLVSDETGFQIERCIGVNSNCQIIPTQANRFYYTDISIEPNTNYCYRVRAVKSAYCGWHTDPADGYSNQMCVDTILNPPVLNSVAPVPLSTTDMRLDWTEGQGTEAESGYRFFRCLDNGSSNCVNDNPATNADYQNITATAGFSGSNINSWVDTTACSDKTYQYVVGSFSADTTGTLFGGGWKHRRQLLFNNSARPFVSNHHTRLVVYYDETMRTDFNDLRFYDEIAHAQIPHWTESTVSGNYAVVWLKTGQNNEISMYYGNPSAANGSSNPSTFFKYYNANIEQTGLINQDLQNAEGYVLEANVARRSAYSYGCNIVFNQTGNGSERSLIQHNLRRYDYDSANTRITAKDSTATAAISDARDVFYRWIIKVYDTDGDGINSDWEFLFDNYLNKVNFGTSYSPLSYTHGTIILGSNDASYSQRCSYTNVKVRSYAPTEPDVTFGEDEAAPHSAWGPEYSNSLSNHTPRWKIPTILAEPDSRLFSEGQILVSWRDTNPDETHFNIYRGDENCQNFTVNPIGTVPGTGVDNDLHVYLDKGTDIDATYGLIYNTTYCYRVTAAKSVFCDWESEPTDPTVSITTTIPKPGTPQLTLFDTTTIDLAWDDTTTTEDIFQIWRCEGDQVTCTGIDDPGQPFGASPVITYSGSVHKPSKERLFNRDPGVCPGHTYTYIIRAVRSGHWNTDSDPAGIQTNDEIVPANLSLVEVYDPNFNQRRIDLRWSDTNSDESGFYIERCKVTVDEDCDAATGNYTSVNSYSNYFDTFDTVDANFWNGYILLPVENAVPPTPWTAITLPKTQRNDISGLVSMEHKDQRIIMKATSTDNNDGYTNLTGYNQTFMGMDYPWYLGIYDIDVSFDWEMLDVAYSYITDGQIVHFNMDDAVWAAAGDVKDSSHTGNQGTANAGATQVAGGYDGTGKAASFNGSNNISWNYAGGTPQTNFTIAAWVKATEGHQIDDPQSNTGTLGTAGQKYLFDAQFYATGAGLGVSVGIDGISVYAHGSGYLPPLAVYSGALGTDWHHIAIVVANRIPSIYLDGNLVRTGLQSTKSPLYAPQRIAANAYGNFKGQVDDVKVFNRNLTADEIKQLHHPENSSTTQYPLRLYVHFVSGDYIIIDRAVDFNTGGFFWWRINTNGIDHDGAEATRFTSGKFRMTRQGTNLSLYVWKDNAWYLLMTRTDANEGDVANAFEIHQYAKRDGIISMTTAIDNFKMNNNAMPNLTYSDTDALDPLSTYYYRVRPFKTHPGGCSEWNAWDNVQLPSSSELTNLAAPANLFASPDGSKKMLLSWDSNVEGETGYLIERKLFNGVFKEIGTAGQDVTSYIDRVGLSADTQYTYRIRAVNDVDIVYSPYSNEYSATTNIHGAQWVDNSTCLPDE